MWEMVSGGDRQARLTLLGAVLIKFATGLAAIWGTCNVYFFSYLKHRGYEVTLRVNSLILLCALVPTCLAVLLSNPFARLVGYKSAVRVSAVAFLVSPLLINVHFSLASFAVCWLVVPLSCFCLGAIPVLNCLWTHFKKDLGKVSGLAVVAFSLGMIVWNILFLFIVNPNNQPAEIDAAGIPIFPEEVSSNIFKASNCVYCIAGAMNVTGSFLISRKEASSLEQAMHEERREEKGKEMAALESEPLVGIERAVSQLESRLSQHSSRSRTESLAQGLRDRRFLLIFSISAVMPVYLIYLVLNVKLIYMPLINDDHYLSYCAALVTVSAVVGAPLWGHVADTRGFKSTLLLLVCFDTLVKLFGIFCTEKWNLAVLFFLLGVNDKGMLTIIGPGLIGMFGIDMATELVPYKGLAVFVGYVLTPTFQIFLGNILSLKEILLIYSGFSVIGVLLALYLNFRVHYKVIDPSKEEELRVLPPK